MVVCVVVLAIACIASIAIGSKHIPLAEVWDQLLHAEGGIVRDLRLPRTAAAVVAGVALGLSGALIQALTRNPLGDPGLLGVSSGAGAAVAVGVVFFGTRTHGQDLAFALLGALIVMIAVAFMGARGRVVDPVRLTLAGVALSAVLAGFITALMLLSPTAFTRIRGWDAGSFVERGWGIVLPVLPLIAIGTVVALLLGRSLNTVALGEDIATALGTGILRTHILTVLAVTLLAGGATAIAGPLAFVGLMAPHVARWIAGPDQRWILLLSMLIAPIVLLVSDILGRILLWPSEVPVGIVTAFVGAPVLIALVRRSKAVGI